jgi:glucoamylase
VLSGGSPADSVRQRYQPHGNELRTVSRYGSVREVSVRSLGNRDVLRARPGWLGRARPLGRNAPPWARRMYSRSLLVLRALTDWRTGAVIAGAREGWAYVWPRDAGAVALAFAAAGYRSEARRIARFLLGLDLTAAARFHPDGSPVAGRAAQGDAAGWVAAAARAAGLHEGGGPFAWRNRADYQEGEPGDYIGDALAASAAREWVARGTGRTTHGSRALGEMFRALGGTLARVADEPDSGIDSAAAWAVRPFPHPALYPRAGRSLLRLAAESSRFGIVPSQDWDGGRDPWTAPTAWTAWSLAALTRRDRQRGDARLARRERRAAFRLMGELRRDATATGMLPERVDARTGIPTSTTPLAWSHAFAVLALRQLWPRKSGETPYGFVRAVKRCASKAR